MSAAGVILEVAVDSPDDALAALAAGAQRVELCADLAVGGLTPPVDWVRRVDEAFPKRVAVMIRPAPGPFTADAATLALMERQIDGAILAGARSVVFGVLDSSGCVDAGAAARLWSRCTGAKAVFHRAVDHTPDVGEAIERLIDVGIERVLTSGGAESAVCALGLAGLGALRERAGGRIQILPGGGVRASNVHHVLAASRATQVHSSCRDAAGRFDLGEVRAMLRVLEAGRTPPAA